MQIRFHLDLIIRFSWECHMKQQQQSTQTDWTDYREEIYTESILVMESSDSTVIPKCECATVWIWNRVALNKSLYAQKSFVLYSLYLDYQGREYTVCSNHVTAANLTRSNQPLVIQLNSPILCSWWGLCLIAAGQRQRLRYRSGLKN